MASEDEIPGGSPIDIKVNGETVEAAVISPPAPEDDKTEVKPLDARVTTQASSNGKAVQAEIISPYDELASKEAGKARFVPSTETTVNSATKTAEKMGIRIVKPGNK